MSEITLNRWYTGEKLAEFIKDNEESKKKNKRFCYKQLMGFLLNKGKDICALYGIRRTGKTVLMLQAIRDLMSVYHISEQKIAYITIGENTVWDDKKLVSEIDKLTENGVCYVFVDEISYLDMNLGENSLNLLADRLAKCGIKIVIAGTFSYAIRLLEKEVLFDRMQKIDTSYFSYKEAHDVFEQNLDTFIKYGGIINFDEDGKQMSPSDYMETAIVNNIVQSIFKSDKKYDLLLTIPETIKSGKTDKELRAVVANLVRITLDNYLKVLVVGKLANKEIYRFSDIGKLAAVIRQRSEQECVENEDLDIVNLDTMSYYRLLAEYLGDSKQMSEDTFREILKILEDIQLKQDISLDDGRVSVFIPNYLRYGLCDEIMKVIGDKIQEETGKRYRADLAGEILMGTIQEAICYLDLKVENRRDFDMYRTADGSCEIDLIIRNRKEGWMDLYEMKHSSQMTGEQVKHLINREFVREIEQEFGCKTRNYYVLYNGRNMEVEYIPQEVFRDLEMKNVNLGKTGNARKWERLRESAAVQGWKPVKVYYRNMEEFLCGLEIVR